jgi:replicative DNA helicase
MPRACPSSKSAELRGGLGVMVVDYLQLVRSSRRHDSREQEVSEVSRELKLLARQLEVPVIAVSQLNRDVEKRADKRPLMSDLRESGAIEQDADVIALLFRQGYYDPNTLYPEECELIIGKNRGGPTGLVRVRFEPEFTRFSDLPPEMRRPATGKGGT